MPPSDSTLTDDEMGRAAGGSVMWWDWRAAMRTAAVFALWLCLDWLTIEFIEPEDRWHAWALVALWMLYVDNVLDADLRRLREQAAYLELENNSIIDYSDAAKADLREEIERLEARMAASIKR